MEQLSSNAIDTAWEMAHAANDAFDQQREIERITRNLREIGGLAIGGVTIAPIAYKTLTSQYEQAKKDFNRFVDAAAPVMLAPESPFALSHGEAQQTEGDLDGFRSDDPIRHLDEMIRFAEVLGYNPQTATRTRNILKRSAATVDRSAYDQNQADGIIIVKNADGSKGFDIHTIYNIVKRWQESEAIDINNIGENQASFLADYLNHALPNIELRVTVEPTFSDHQKEVKTNTQHKLENLRRMSPHELLLDTTDEKEPRHYVSAESLTRFFISEGVSQRGINNIGKILGDLLCHANPNYQENGRGFAYTNEFAIDEGDIIDRGEERPPGITPGCFIDLIHRLDEAGVGIKGCGEKTRPKLDKYIRNLRQLMTAEEALSSPKT